MSNTIEVTLPTGAKAVLTEVDPKGYGKGKKCQGKKFHALVNPTTGRWDGFGILAKAKAASLPTSVLIDGTEVKLKSDTSNSGKPRVSVNKAPLPNGKAATIRLVDMGEGAWNYIIEVVPASTGTGGRKVLDVDLFS